jgi:hypothetical protein
MLAYVFWHWRRSSVDASVYETDLIQFHDTLQSNKPAGFYRSVVFLIEKAPWLTTDSAAYEEWYLLEDSAAMDRINYAAVHGACEESHNSVAKNALGGVGGLYRLRAGLETLDKATYATWFSKPNGVSYADFDARLEPIVTENNATLWARQMTLGPTTEFCLHNSSQIQPVPELTAATLSLETIWRGQKVA